MEKNDLWWQVRSLQELGWTDELKSLLIRHQDDIKRSGDQLLLRELARALRDNDALVEVEKEIARRGPEVYFLPSSDDKDEEDEET